MDDSMSAVDQKPRKRKWDVAEPALSAQSPAAGGGDLPPPPAYAPPPPPGPILLDPTNPAAVAAFAASRLAAAKAAAAASVTPPLPSTPATAPAATPREEGLLVGEVEINSCPPPVRYLLTKGATHQEIQQQTGATVSTRGRFRASHEPVEPGSERALYLHVSAPTQAELDAGLARIHALMRGDVPAYHRREDATAKVYVGFDVAEARRMGFNYVGKIIGPKGAYVKHIEAQSRARVQLKGRGRSDNPHEPPTPEGSGEDDDLHLLIIASNQQALEAAKKLSEDLLGTVREDFEDHKRVVAARAAAAASPRVPSGYGHHHAMPGYGASGYGAYGAAYSYGAPAPPVYGAPPYGLPPTAYGSTYNNPSAPGTEQTAAAYSTYPSYGYGTYGYAAPPSVVAPATGPPGTEAVAGPPGMTSSTAAEAAGADDTTVTSASSSRRFQEYPAPTKRARTDGDEDCADESEVGPKRPTLKEYSAARYALPDAPVSAVEQEASAVEPTEATSGSHQGHHDRDQQTTLLTRTPAAAAQPKPPGLPFWAASPYSQSPLASTSSVTPPAQSSSSDASYSQLMRELGMERH